MTEEEHEKLKDLKSMLNSIKDLFSMVKRNEDELLDTLTVVEGYLRNSNIRDLIKEKEEICKRISVSTQQLLPAGAIQTSNIEAAQSLATRETFHEVKGSLSSSPTPQDLEMLKVNYNNVLDYPKRCLLSLLLLPDNAVIKKSNIILWWNEVENINGEEHGMKVLHELLNSKLIVPHRRGKNPIVNKFKINPWAYHMLKRSLLQNGVKENLKLYSQIISSSHRHDLSYTILAIDQQKVKLSDGFDFKSNHWRVVFNVSASYLNFDSQWITKMKSLEVLQLGRWLHDSASHHIEVVREEFLKQLKGQKYLRYISFRGISGISKLPSSIFQLKSLETLDLKACHNLETLPNDISSLRNLRHLDLSKCPLLDRMPKGIEKLTKLKVLKGFVKGSSSKSSYKISHLVNLKKLVRLSIFIERGAVIYNEEFLELEELFELKHLKISWNVSDVRYSDIDISFPLKIEKLHLEGFPGENIPKWLEATVLTYPGNFHHIDFPRRNFQKHIFGDPTEVTKVLKITGGKLKSLNLMKVDCFGTFKGVSILILKYLKHLEVDLTSLRLLFPSLRYFEIKKISNHPDVEWSEDEDR